MAKNLFLNYRTIEIDIDMDIFNPESSNNESNCKTPTIAHVLLGIHIYNQLENPVLCRGSCSSTSLAIVKAPDVLRLVVGLLG
jgi:hypothetical protein